MKPLTPITEVREPQAERRGRLKQQAGSLGHYLAYLFHIAINRPIYTVMIAIVLTLYTDGITEVCNLNRQQYGLGRLCEVVSRYWQGTAESIQPSVIADLRNFIGKQQVFDDITLLVLKQN